MTTYFVSGFMRTGTSMMMRALEAGGLEAVRNPNRESTAERHADEYYHPNPGGLYELTGREYQAWDFPSAYRGKLVKCLYGGIIRICALDGYRIVFMRRDAEEIRQSYEAFFGYELPMSTKNIIDRIELSLATLHQRRDVQVTVFWYRDVVSDPIGAFSLLQTMGWPINPQKAAEIVDPKLCRYRLERLTVGA